MFSSLLLTLVASAAPLPDPAEQAAESAVYDAIGRYRDGDHPVYTGTVTFTRHGESQEHALTGTLLSVSDALQDTTTLRLSSGGHITVSVVGHVDEGYTVILRDGERGTIGGEEARVARAAFSADPLSAAASLTLEPAPYTALDRVAGHISLSLRRLPVDEIDWDVLVAVSHAAPVAGLALSTAAQRQSILQHEGGRLVRGEVTPIVLETRDASPDCQTFYTFTRSRDVAFDVLVSPDLAATVQRIERGRERVDERCQW